MTEDSNQEDTQAEEPLSLREELAKQLNQSEEGTEDANTSSENSESIEESSEESDSQTYRPQGNRKKESC